MKHLILGALLVGAATFGFAEGNKFGIGVDGNIYNNTRTQTSKTDYVSSSLDLRVFAAIPLSETTELDPSVSVLLFSTKDPSTLVDGYTYNQNGAGVGLGYYAALASAGPFTLLGGALAELKYLGLPDDSTGDWTYWYGHFALPLIVRVDVGANLSLRVTQTVLDLYGRTKSYANVHYGFSSLQFNQFGPSVGCVYKF